MEGEYIIRSIEDVITISKTLSESWFRGQAKCYNDLTPKVFRERYQDPIFRTFRSDYELTMIEYFKQRAPALETNLPSVEDDLGWLFLMQHHGTPTRLLDWTKSILVALFFTVENDIEEDGELWCMYALELNRAGGLNGMPMRHHSILKYLTIEPTTTKYRELADSLNLDDIPLKPIALEPTINCSRMVTQNSKFTIHPSPTPGNTIPELLTDKRQLVRYLVPSTSKTELRKNLKSLCIDRDSLFQDLDSLSKSIIYEHNTLAYGPPEPPKFS